MKVMGGLLGAVLGGVIGAAIWAAIVYFTGYEIGWIAWGIGALVGVGAMMGVRAGGGVPNNTLPFMAAGVALLAVVGGKYAAIEVLVQNLGASEELMISYVADDIVIERIDAGQRVNWPSGVNPDEAYREVDYPPAIWAEADQRWKSFSPDEQAQYTKDIQGFIQANRTQGLLASFTPFDILWLLLAAATAWKIAGDTD